MRLHYVFFGMPTPELIRRVIKTIGLYSGAEPVSGMLWVLDDNRKMIATSLFAGIEDRKSIRFLNDESEAGFLSSLSPQPPEKVFLIKSAISELQNHAIPPKIFFPKQDRIFSASGRFDRMPENLFSAYFAMTQMILSYLSVLSHPIEALPREFVTAKELFALWLAYTYGGVILDAGCDAFQAWNLDSLNPKTFFVPRVFGEGFFSYSYIKIPIQAGGSNDIELMIDNLIPFLEKCIQEIPSLSTCLAASLAQRNQTEDVIDIIDNWMIISPVHCPIPLFALRYYLCRLELLYKILENKKEDEVIAELGDGQFASFSALISENAIIQGYYENWKKYPDDAPNTILINEEISLMNVTIQTTGGRDKSHRLLVSQDFKIIGLRKTITPFQKNTITGKIVSGWRAPLSSEQAAQVLGRYRVFSSIWGKMFKVLLNR